MDSANSLRIVPGSGLRRIGRAHHFAVLGNGAFAFQNLNHNRLRRHEGAQFAVKAALFVLGIKRTGLRSIDRWIRLEATTRRPASSNLATILPVRLRLVASGLMIDKVRSMAIWLSGFGGHCARNGCGGLLSCRPGLGKAQAAPRPVDAAAPLGQWLRMLKIEAITYSVEGRPLFEGASATIPTGHKVGLVGRNGAGKTTLFRLIKRELALESGEISMPSRARIGGVAQEVPSSSTSLLDTVLQADTERTALMAEAETATDPTRIAEIQHRLTDIDAWSAEGRASSILRGLGFEPDQQLRPCSDFSGGWRMRVALAGVLFAQPDYLLLDEPTNYLDLEGALWLESYLQKYPHTVLIISHDRGLLNRAVGAILHLDNRKLTLWNGPYDQFARQSAERRALQAAEAKKQTPAAPICKALWIGSRPRPPRPCRRKAA